VIDKADIDERLLAAEVAAAWAIDVADLAFMPVGLDGQAWAYRIDYPADIWSSQAARNAASTTAGSASSNRVTTIMCASNLGGTKNVVGFLARSPSRSANPVRMTIEVSSSCRATNRPPSDHLSLPLADDSRTRSSRLASSPPTKPVRILQPSAPTR
jgi:hypothetical protein